MTQEEAIVSLSGQVVNGIMSSNSSIITKALEAPFHTKIAEISVKIAVKMYEEIQKACG